MTTLRSRLCSAAFLALSLFLLPAKAGATFDLTISPLTNSFSWSPAVDPSTPTAVATYTLYRKFGLSVNPLVGGTLIGSVSGATSVSFGGHLTGSFCYQLEAANAQSGVYDSSAIACHS